MPLCVVWSVLAAPVGAVPLGVVLAVKAYKKRKTRKGFQNLEEDGDADVCIKDACRKNKGFYEQNMKGQGKITLDGRKKGMKGYEGRKEIS